MADDDMNEQYFDDEDDFDWFYVEENYPLAVSHEHVNSGRCRHPVSRSASC